MAAYKYPRLVWLVDALPKGPTGKLLKREITIPTTESRPIAMARSSGQTTGPGRAGRTAGPTAEQRDQAVRQPDDARTPPGAHFGVNLAKQPGAVADRISALTRELGAIAAGKSTVPRRGPTSASADPAWEQNPLLHKIMQGYLAGAETAERLLADAALDWRDSERMRFVVDNLVEGLAPTNNPLISPLGWKAMIDTGGLSAVRGVKAFARDMLSKPRVPAMVEPDAFVVGETAAVTKGAVVLQTSMFELIQYAPQTPEVRTIPLLMVPPVINKYYIMDIAPGRSMIEYFVQQGQQVFAISWRNPQARHRDWGFDAYGAALVEAMDAVQKIAGDRQRPPAGYVLGRHHRGDDGGPPRRHRRGRSDRRPQPGGHRAGRDPRRFRRRGNERPRGAGGDSSFGQEGLPRRA